MRIKFTDFERLRGRVTVIEQGDEPDDACQAHTHAHAPGAEAQAVRADEPPEAAAE